MPWLPPTEPDARLADPRLRGVPTEALCYALGMAAATPRPVSAARLVALAAELVRRDAWNPLLDALEPQMAAALVSLVAASGSAARPRFRQARTF